MQYTVIGCWKLYWSSIDVKKMFRYNKQLPVLDQRPVIMSKIYYLNYFQFTNISRFHVKTSLTFSDIDNSQKKTRRLGLITFWPLAYNFKQLVFKLFAAWWQYQPYQIPYI